MTCMPTLLQPYSTRDDGRTDHGLQIVLWSYPEACLPRGTGSFLLWMDAACRQDGWGLRKAPKPAGLMRDSGRVPSSKRRT